MEPITTLYLDKCEYERLRQIKGYNSIKRRYNFSDGLLDVYQEPNAGLMIYELEFDSEDAALIYQPPAFVSQDITGLQSCTRYQLAKPG